jgi:hypothetical protein
MRRLKGWPIKGGLSYWLELFQSIPYEEASERKDNLNKQEVVAESLFGKGTHQPEVEVQIVVIPVKDFVELQLS